MRNYSGNEEVNRSDQLHEKLLCNMAMANFIYLIFWKLFECVIYQTWGAK